MSLKMKSFKKSILGADIRQLWVQSLLYGGMIFFGTFFDFYLNKKPYGNAIPYSFVNSRFFQYSCFSNFLGVVAGGVLALRLFAYLYSSSAVSFYHGLPFKRKSLFMSKLLSGAVLLIVPVLINFAIVAASKLCGSDIQIRWLGLIYWLGNQLIYSLLAFSCVTFSVMLSGNVLALLVTCLMLGIAPAVIIGFIHTVCQNYLLGYAYNPENFITFFYIMPDILLFKLRGLIYVIAIPVLLIISYFMYKKRDLERCGEAVVFPKLKIAFVYFAGLLGGIFSYFYFSIWSFKSILFMLPFGIVAVIIANMINRRGITLKGAFLHTIIFSAFVIFLLCSFRFDIIGFEKRIPNIENIDSVTVIPDRYFNYRYDEKDYENYKITGEEDIKTVMAYHEHTIADSSDDSQYAPSYVELSYTLKNGRKLKRGYDVNFLEEREYFEKIADFEQTKKALYPIYNANELEIVNVDLYNFLGEIILYPNNEFMKKLLDAMSEDIKNLPYDENAALFWSASNSNTPLYVNIEYKYPTDSKPFNSSFYFPISFGFTKTMELLKEYGYYDRFMTVKNIVSVGIDKLDDNKGGFEIKNDLVDEIITEPEKMQEILDELQTQYKTPVWKDDNEFYDEYIFLDTKGEAHSTVLNAK